MPRGDSLNEKQLRDCLRLSRLRCAPFQSDPRDAATDASRPPSAGVWKRPIGRPRRIRGGRIPGPAGRKPFGAARIGELMFVEVIRRYLTTLTAEESNWLAGLRDPLVGRALASLHQRANHSWTLEKLAREVATSRSVLAERFTHFVGEPPMHYLTRWRMQRAARLLSGNTAKVSAVAREVGYNSEAAFSRAFKKLTGVAPAAWRNRLATPGLRTAGR
jgi:AraC-like DNA-binding protein